MMFLRVRIPDSPGSLGHVATVLGDYGADILAIEVVQRTVEGVVDDFVLQVPTNVMPDEFVSACNAIDGVKVLWISRNHEPWSIAGDIEILNQMAAQPSRSASILTEAAPALLNSSWAVLIDHNSNRLLTGTSKAPDIDAGVHVQLHPTEGETSVYLDTDWLPDWSQSVVLTVPLRDGQCLSVGRQGGPEFLDSEVARLRHLSSLAHTTG